ncbi:hypothetical protein ACSMDK_12670 [Yersinia enterocolitica]|uniref:hypothetical protein n=1 Tax=Yersinia TaxID=629 RepID=UPI003AB57CEE
MKATVKFYPLIAVVVALSWSTPVAAYNEWPAGDLVNVQWTGINRLSATVANVGRTRCEHTGCGAVYYGVKYEGQDWKKVTGDGLPQCDQWTDLDICWNGKTVTFVGLSNQKIEKVRVQTMIRQSLGNIDSDGQMPPRPEGCTFDSQSIKLGDMHPGQTANDRRDSVRVKCGMTTDLHITIVTPTITYTPGAVSTISAPTKLRVDDGVPTAVPITITTRVDPSDVVAGSYTQAIVLKIEPD